MHLRFTLKAVQSLQSFSPDIQDDVVIFGEILGVPVTLSTPSAELLAKLDEVLSGLEPQESRNAEYVHYQEAADYQLGDVDD